MKKVYIIIGAYSMEAGYKVLRGYSNKERAEKDLAMIQDVDVAGRDWGVEEVEIIDGYPELFHSIKTNETK